MILLPPPARIRVVPGLPPPLRKEPPMSTRPAIGEAAVEQLDAVLAGSVVTPEHPDYDEARKVWNGMIDRRPALIAQCKAVADVIQAVDFARANAMTVAVRSGGHS